jgi:hypothetical protein
MRKCSTIEEALHIHDMTHNKRKKKKTQLPNVQNFMEDVIWLEDDIKINYEILPEYSDSYQMYFGATPKSEVSFGNVFIRKEYLDSWHDYLATNGFIFVEQSSKGVKKAISFDKKIVIDVEDGRRDGKKGEDEDYPSRNFLSIDFYHHGRNKEFINELVDNILEWIEDESEKKNNFYMIAQGQQGLYNEKTSFKAIPVKDNRWDLYYGEDFKYEKFSKFMKEDNTNSLLLLHGDPGGGKSNLLKNLILEANRDVIYIPPSMVGLISQPAFVTYMLSNRKSILVIEDAESVLGKNRNDGTNNILNICDGFLKDALSIKIVATFNAHIDDIDPALLRRGRLYASHEFRKLTPKEANKLAQFCDIDHTFDEDVTLADIFNIADEKSDLLKESKPMGFGNF